MVVSKRGGGLSIVLRAHDFGSGSNSNTILRLDFILVHLAGNFEIAKTAKSLRDSREAAR